MIRNLVCSLGLIVSVCCSADAGTFVGQGRSLDGSAIPDVTVTAIRSDGRVIFNRSFAGGNYTIPVNDASLFAQNKSISLLFSSPGRDDARLDNVLGTTNIAGLDVVLPLKISAPGPCTPGYPPVCVPYCNDRCWRSSKRCR
jgi:hypothetical protein